jgi:hypothetical protein
MKRLLGSGHRAAQRPIAAAAAATGATSAEARSALRMLVWPLSMRQAVVAASVQAWRVAAPSMRSACLWKTPSWKYAACGTIQRSKATKIIY